MSPAAQPAVRQRPRGPAVDWDRVPAVVAKIRQVPSRLRRFNVTAEEARARHQLDASLLSVLLAEGLPSVGAGTDRLFDDYDLGNVALHLGLMSVRRMAIRSWASALRRTSLGEVTALRVSYHPRCPVPGHPGPCQFGLLTPGGRRLIKDGPPDGSVPLEQLAVQVTRTWPQASPRLSELLAEIDAIDFFILPEAIRWDTEFMFRAKIADCGAAADWLVTEGRRRGLRSRFAFGLLTVKPYSTPHCWPEFFADGRWVPHDPLILGAMRSWAALPARDWPVDRSTGSAVVRLGPRFTKVAAHGGVWSTISLPTEYLP